MSLKLCRADPSYPLLKLVTQYVGLAIRVLGLYLFRLTPPSSAGIPHKM